MIQSDGSYHLSEEETADSSQLALGAQELSRNIIAAMNLSSDVEWANEVKEVLVLLSASRSGSSLIFQALAGAPDVIAPAGEHEPWLFLSENKHPFTDSDHLMTINNKSLLLKLLRNDLLVRDEKTTTSEWAQLIRNRLLLRQNFHDLSDWHIESLIDTLAVPPVLHSSYWPIENPPYIDQPRARRATLTELKEKTLLFKSPSDAYRPGFYESLFPNANIKYIHLTRGFAQTVNGLMDGWGSNEVDFISNALGVASISIADYSVTDLTRKYWCFDLFPGWQKYTNKSLLDVCARQWLEAHQSILHNFKSSARIKFEEFYSNQEMFLEGLQKATGIKIIDFDWQKSVMSTEKPRQYRWKKRSEIFQNLENYLDKETLHEVKVLQHALGYTMEESTWV